jgi:hypothetical protein
MLPGAIALAAAIGGALVAVYYHRLGLTLTHYDARGHLVVARRIFDSITPGWQQIGAVWLPLPHLLNAIPVQIDLFYRTGASGVAISVIAFAIACGAIATIVRTTTGSAAAAIAGAAVFALNPNVLYLQSTPMSEPLLIALVTLSLALLMTGIVDSTSQFARERSGVTPVPSTRTTRMTGAAFALACMTRYEAWPVTAAALAGGAWARWRAGDSFDKAVRAMAGIALYPAAAIVTFAIFSRVVIGEWFVAGGFFVPENKALGDRMIAARELGWGVQMLSGALLVWIGAAGAAVLAVVGLVSRRRGYAVVPLSLLAGAVIPWTAFFHGHPFRIRYAVPLLAMEATGAGIAAAVIPRLGVAGAVVLLSVAGAELRPLDPRAPMVVESQWDRPNQPVRDEVTACIGRPGSGEKIMASMGSLGHYMQEASGVGFAIRDFLHEGNGDIWLAALADGPRSFAEWVLIEEKAEGGDMLAQIARERPGFLNGYARVCEGAGLVLYKRTNTN